MTAVLPAALPAALLAALVATVWLGCLGFARLASPLDRLHCAAFVNAAGGALLIAVALAADGLSIRTLKTVLAVAAGLAAGAACSHGLGRALMLRSRGG